MESFWANKRNILIAVAVAAAIVIIALLAGRSSRPAGVPPGAAAPPPPPGPVTREAAPKNVVVPEQGASVPANVAAPQNVAPLNPNTTSKNRTFSIKADNNQFSPSTIIARTGDNLDISIAAVDKNYDFSQPDYGYGDGKFVIPKGQTKRVIFQVTASGKFTFYCSLCGGLKSGAVGYIIVE